MSLCCGSWSVAVIVWEALIFGVIYSNSGALDEKEFKDLFKGHFMTAAAHTAEHAPAQHHTTLSHA